MEYILPLIFTALTLGLVPALIARKQGRTFFIWYIYGVCLFFFAMIHAIILLEKSNNETHSSVTASVGTRKSVVNGTKINSVLIDPSCPAELICYELKVSDNNCYINLKFKNLSPDNTINALKVKVFCYDSFYDPVTQNGSNIVEKTLQDIEAYPGSFFGEQKHIILEGLADTRSIKVFIKSILFCDGTLWEFKAENVCNIKIDGLTGNNLRNLRLVADGEDAICYAKDDGPTWQCVCGRPNLTKCNICLRCNRTKEFVLSACTSTNRVKTELERKNQIQRAERQKYLEQAKKNTSIRKKRFFFFCKIGLPISTIILAAMFVNTNVILPQKAYNHAKQLVECGDYQTAISDFTKLGTYKDSEDYVPYCWYLDGKKYLEENRYMDAITSLSQAIGIHDSVILIDQAFNGQYNTALDLLENKQYRAAQDMFTQIKDYSDSSSRIQECKYFIAKEYLDKKSYNKAIEMLNEITDYKGSTELLKECTYQKALGLLSLSKPVLKSGEKENINGVAYKRLIEPYMLLTVIRTYKDVDEILKRDFFLHELTGVKFDPNTWSSRTWKSEDNKYILTLGGVYESYNDSTYLSVKWEGPKNLSLWQYLGNTWFLKPDAIVISDDFHIYFRIVDEGNIEIRVNGEKIALSSE